MSYNTCHLSLVGACASVQVKEAITVGAEVAAHVTQDDGRCLPIVMIITHRLWIEEEEIKCSSF